jgi:hypothetical protein
MKPALCILILGAFAIRFEAAQTNVELRWLDQKPQVAQGASWGVPWAKGTMSRNSTFTVADAQGRAVAVQTWPLAFWPDGSLKWTGHAITAPAGVEGSFQLSFGNPVAPETALQATDTGAFIEIKNGATTSRIAKRGASLVDSIRIGERAVARDGQLVCILEDRSEYETRQVLRDVSFTSEIESAALEQSGPVRAVVKFTGKHKTPVDRAWLPFVVRLYFYAGSDAIRMVHTIIFDGDQEKDFIKGLGVRFKVPMTEEIQNRHVRFSGDGEGLWSEPIQPLIGRGGRFINNPSGGGDVYRDQIEGRRVPNKDQVNNAGKNLLNMWAVWDDFRLIQPNADGFTIEKRTNPKSAWIPAGAGKRSSGLVFAGDVSGGLAVGVKNFWQSYPASLEVRRASSEAAELIAWLWSPDAPPMDLRHYDIKAHGLDEVYEDVQEGFSTAHGVARTSELMLYATPGVPTRQQTAQMAQQSSRPPQLVCTPQHLHSARAFGLWSLSDRSTPFKQTLEDRLDATVNYYLKQVDERDWYGFWDFGDVMHSYDNSRHVWRYDLGGMAWDNSELGTDMWLWYSFLRTGRADIFRMAEAMTRHTGEVDCYHLGRFNMLGSRHNVRHWGCGAKEARISQAAYRRFYYYLTTDERTGDLMREVVNSDFATVALDPMRLARPLKENEKQYPTRTRLGPDWIAFVGNWMTEWERTGDTKWRDKILTGVECLTAMPLGMRSGGELVFGYDPATGKLYKLNDEAGSYNLATIMGGMEVAMELTECLDDPRWHKLWNQYCRLYGAPRDVLLRDKETGTEGNDGSYLGGQQSAARLAGHLYWLTKNPVFAQRAVTSLARFGGGRGGGRGALATQPWDTLNPVDESVNPDTNGAAQNSLNIIAVLELCADQLPREVPALPEGRGRVGRSNPPGSSGPPAAQAPRNQ